MAGSPYEVTCPVCGRLFCPPTGAVKYFCPQCGMRMEERPVLSSEEAQAQAMRAVEQAAAVAEQAAQAAKLAGQEDMRIQSVDEAQEAVRKAMEAVRMAQEATRVQEQLTQEQKEMLAQSKAEFERTMQEIQQRDAEMAARHKAEAEELKRKQEAEAQRRAQEAEERRRAQEAQAQRQAAAAQQAAAQQAAAQQKRPVEYRRNVVVRHTDGRGLYVVTIPTNWSVKTTMITQGTRTYNPLALLVDGEGGAITMSQGDAGSRLSAGMKAMMSTYGAAIAAVDSTNYASMPNAQQLADSEIVELVQQNGGSNLYLVKEVPSTHLQELRQESERLYYEAGSVVGNTLLKDPYVAEVLRIYEYDGSDGAHKKAAVYVRVCAIKDASGVENLNPMGLAFNLGSSLGGLFSKKKAARAQAQTQQAPAAGGASSWSLPAYDDYMRGGTIYWDVYATHKLISAAEGFEKRLNDAFLPLVRSFEVHGDIKNLVYGARRQEAAQVQQATNQQIHAMNMQTQATIAAAQQASAAHSAMVDDYLRQSDAHHQAFRERTNAQFNTGYGSSSPDFSEAIRGVNTFMTSDGREVELDVSADRAYENQAGDVIGGSGGFDPGADWTEIPRV